MSHKPPKYDMKNPGYRACIRAKRSEDVAAAHFISLGYRVLWRAISGGPDLIVMRGEQVLAVEVKRAFRRAQSLNGWDVSRVSSNRVGDDLVAVVLPDESVLVFSLSDFIQRKTPTVSQMVLEACPNLRNEPAATHRKSGMGFLAGLIHSSEEAS